MELCETRVGNFACIPPHEHWFGGDPSDGALLDPSGSAWFRDAPRGQGPPPSLNSREEGLSALAHGHVQLGFLGVQWAGSETVDDEEFERTLAWANDYYAMVLLSGVTSLAQPFQEMARRAFRVLRAQSEGSKVEPSQLVPVKLVTIPGSPARRPTGL